MSALRIVTARRAWTCRTINWRPDTGSLSTPRRVLDGGPVPADHTPEIQPGERHVHFEMYGEKQRMCEGCARAAGVMPA
jgi:hypothetical protein